MTNNSYSRCSGVVLTTGGRFARRDVMSPPLSILLMETPPPIESRRCFLKKRG